MRRRRRRRPETNGEDRPGEQDKPDEQQGLFGFVTNAIRIMSTAPPGAVAFIFGLVALTITAVLLMKIVPKDTPMRDLQPTIFAFFTLIILTLIAAVVHGAIHKREEKAQIAAHQQTFNAIRRLHGV